MRSGGAARGRAVRAGAIGAGCVALLLAAVIVPVPAPAESAAGGRGGGTLAERDLTTERRDPFAPEFQTRGDDVWRAGVFGEGDGIGLANLTVTPGRYIVAYAFDARLDGAEAGALQCGVADSNGRGGLLFAGDEEVRPNQGWTRMRFITRFGLPDLTLALRCSAPDGYTGVARFRDVRLVAGRMQ